MSLGDAAKQFARLEHEQPTSKALDTIPTESILTHPLPQIPKPHGLQSVRRDDGECEATVVPGLGFEPR